MRLLAFAAALALIAIQPAAAQGIGMAIHELSTNAIKYGALSNDAGKISISWQCEANRDGKLRIMWSEKDGPTVLAPDHRGFGFTVIERMTAIATGGKVDLSYDSAGLRWVLEAPSANVIATSEGRHISG